VFGAFLVTILGACDSTGLEESGPTSIPVSLSLAASPTAQTATSAAGPQVALRKRRELTDDSGARLVLDRIEVVLEDIEFEREEGSSACDGDDGDNGDDNGADEGNDDGCEEVEAGPLLASIPLDGGEPQVVADVQLPNGAWEEVEFEIESLDDDDRSLIESTGFPEDVSVRVTGTFTPAGGSPRSFTYTSDLEAEKELEFDPPLNVSGDGPTNVTFSLAVDSWFRQANGALIDPDQAGDDGPFEDLVEDNIEASFEGFEDADRDGRRDDDDGDDDDDDDDGDDDDEDDDDNGDDD
jgi:hypothetical protein